MKKLNYIKRSFKYALRGIVYAWKTEQNFRSEAVIGIVVFIMSLVFPLRPIQQLLIWLLIFWVLTLELINTVLERTLDIVSSKKHEYIEIAKDLMAGAVLVSAAGSLVIGAIVFYPHLETLFCKVFLNF